jgi:hypothetical protein
MPETLNLTMLGLLGASDRPEIYECANDQCLELIHPARYALGYRHCLACGDREAVRQRKLWCIAPISNKAGYTRVTDYNLLKQINPKRTEA